MTIQLSHQRLLNKKRLMPPIVALLVLIGLTSSTTAFSQATTNGPFAVVSITETKIEWLPKVEHNGMTLTVSGPGDVAYRQVVDSDADGGLAFGLNDANGIPYPDGMYTYELVVNPVLDQETRNALKAARETSTSNVVMPRQVQTGYFVINNGKFITPNTAESPDEERTAPLDMGPAAPQDIVHADDVIIDGSLCVGNDCYSGLAFGFDTIVMMENNLRIFFDDTSTIQNYPRNDWRIIINDSTDGGGRYFAIEDATEVSNIFVLEAGAPDNSIYVDSYGDVGINTSTPYYELHIVDGDSPAIRLDQDGSYGWTPQKWDLCGNESNFFIRDATHASKLPFRIEPDAPTDSIFVKSNGDVGIGTGAPGGALEIERTGENAKLVLQRTDGDKWVFNSAGGGLRIAANDPPTAQVLIETDGDMTIQGSLTEASDVNVKKNFVAVDGRQVLAAVMEMPITTWSFKADDTSARHIGPTAQDFHAAYGLGVDDKHIAPKDVAGVALAAIQGLNEVVSEQDAQIKALEEQNADMRARLAALEQTMEGGTDAKAFPSNLLPWILVGVLAGVLLGVVVTALGFAFTVGRQLRSMT
jgi:hypothetical protein